MRVLLAAQSVPEDQSTTHRVLWPARELRKRGHDVTVVFGVKQRIGGRSLRMVNPRALSAVFQIDYDIVVVSRDASPLARALQVCSDIRDSSFIFDFDDAIYKRMNIVGTSIPNPSRLCLGSILSNADCVTTGTDRMTAFAADYNNSARTLTTPANTDVFKPDIDPPRKYERPVVGWMGAGSGHVDNLRLLVNPLVKLAEEGYDFRFRIISALDDDVRKIFRPVEECVPVDYGFTSWKPIERIVEEMQTFDIGVCPLTMDDPYMEGKSPMKVLQMMATELPVVASDSGTYSDVVSQGSTGLLAASDDEWTNALKTLLDRPGYRTELATRGREYVLKNHTFEMYGDELESVLQEVVV